MSYALNIFKRTCDLSLQIGSSLLPTVVSTAIEAGLQDKRIGKIVTGCALLGSGIYILGKSGIPTQIRSRFSKTMGTPEQETLSKKTVRWGLAGAGLAIAGTGALCVYSGITELASPTSQQAVGPFPSSSPTFKPMPIEKSETQELKECTERFDQAMQSLSGCTAASDLLREVDQGGNFTIECVPKSQINWPAAVNLSDRAVYLSTYFPPGSIKEPMEDSILFELNNLKQQDSFFSVSGQMCSLDKHEYAVQMEKIEYETLKMTNDVVASCDGGRIWSSPKQQTPEWTNYLGDRAVSGHLGAFHLQWTAECSPEALKNQTIWFKFLHDNLGYGLPPNFEDMVAKLPKE